MIASLAFYVFACILIFSALSVITARNPVHSVLFLILGFFNTTGLFILLGAEFIAFILAIVYVGAVAVLFLFVVMMLDVDFANLRKGAMRYVPLGLIIGSVLLAEMAFIFAAWDQVSTASMNFASKMPADAESNAHALGEVLYTQYLLPFQLSGVILLVAMIGAIVLTLRNRGSVKRQKIDDQTRIKRDEVVSLQRITPGTGG